MPKYTYPCLVFEQRPNTNHRFAMFSAPVGEVLKWAEVDRLRPDSPRSPQRRTSKARVKGLKRFLELSEENTIPTAIIVSLKLGENGLTQVECEGVAVRSIHNLSIDVDENTTESQLPGLVVDGQHRLYGMNEYDPTTRVGVVALLNPSDDEVAFQFLVINNKSSSVSTDHLRALSLTYNNDALSERLKTARLTLSDNLPLVALIDTDAESPFYGFVDWPNNADENRRIKPAALEAALAGIQQTGVRQFNDKDILIEFFYSMWNAIKNQWPGQWDTENSRLFKKIGIICMSTYLTDALVAESDMGQLDLADPDKVQERVSERLQRLRPEFWSTQWTSSSYDTRAGRDIVVQALKIIARNIRAEIVWYEEVDLIDRSALECEPD